MIKNSQIVFNCRELRDIIFKYITYKKCIFCNCTLTKNNKILLNKFKNFNNLMWKSERNIYRKNICNWCYYYQSFN